MIKNIGQPFSRITDPLASGQFRGVYCLLLIIALTDISQRLMIENSGEVTSISEDEVNIGRPASQISTQLYRAYDSRLKAFRSAETVTSAVEDVPADKPLVLDGRAWRGELSSYRLLGIFGGKDKRAVFLSTQNESLETDILAFVQGDMIENLVIDDVKEHQVFLKGPDEDVSFRLFEPLDSGVVD